MQGKQLGETLELFGDQCGRCAFLLKQLWWHLFDPYEQAFMNVAAATLECWQESLLENSYADSQTYSSFVPSSLCDIALIVSHTKDLMQTCLSALNITQRTCLTILSFTRETSVFAERYSELTDITVAFENLIKPYLNPHLSETSLSNYCQMMVHEKWQEHSVNHLFSF